MYSVHVVIFISNHRVIFGIAFSHFLSFHLIRNNKMPLVDDFFIQFNRLRFLWSFSNYIWLNKEKDLRAQTNKPQMYKTYGIWTQFVIKNILHAIWRQIQVYTNKMITQISNWYIKLIKSVLWHEQSKQSDLKDSHCNRNVCIW